MMDYNKTELIRKTMQIQKLNCPLCRLDFKYRANLRNHIKGEHFYDEIQKYLIKKGELK